MIPVVKGWSTEIGIEVASLGIQVHGGMGYMEETGAAQYLRDSRISTIYEGTTGIQANDLIGRKMARDRGAVFKSVIGMMCEVERELVGSANVDLKAIGARLAVAVDALNRAGGWIVERFPVDVRAASASAVPFLRLFGVVAGGWQMARAALVAQARVDAGDGDPFYHAKVITARFYADHLLTQAEGLASTVVDGSGAVLAMPLDQY